MQPKFDIGTAYLGFVLGLFVQGVSMSVIETASSHVLKQDHPANGRANDCHEDHGSVSYGSKLLPSFPEFNSLELAYGELAAEPKPETQHYCAVSGHGRRSGDLTVVLGVFECERWERTYASNRQGDGKVCKIGVHFVPTIDRLHGSYNAAWRSSYNIRPDVFGIQPNDVFGPALKADEVSRAA